MKSPRYQSVFYDTSGKFKKCFSNLVEIRTSTKKRFSVQALYNNWQDLLLHDTWEDVEISVHLVGAVKCDPERQRLDLCCKDRLKIKDKIIRFYIR